MTGHLQYTPTVHSLINITQIKNDWHSIQTSRQESQSKLNGLKQTTLSGALCFFAKENKCPIKIQSIANGAAPYHRLGVKRQGEEAVVANKSCMMPLSLSLLCQRKLPGNSPWIVRSPGWGYNMYIHETEQLTAQTRHPFTTLLVSESRKLPLESLFDESLKVIFRRTAESHFVYVAQNCMLLCSDLAPEFLVVVESIFSFWLVLFVLLS